MKRLILLAAFAVLALPAAASARTYVVDGCAPDGVRPKTVVVFCGDAGLYFTKLSWSSFGGSRAHATGIQNRKTCKPNCAAGGVQKRRATLTFSDRRVCAGRSGRYYRKVKAVTRAGTKRYAVPCPV